MIDGDHNSSSGWGGGMGTSSMNSTLEVVEFAGEIGRDGSSGEEIGE